MSGIQNYPSPIYLFSEIDHKAKVKKKPKLKYSRLKHFQRYYSDCQNFTLVKKSLQFLTEVGNPFKWMSSSQYINII